MTWSPATSGICIVTLATHELLANVFKHAAAPMVGTRLFFVFLFVKNATKPDPSQSPMAAKYVFLLLLAAAAVQAAEEPLADSINKDGNNALWARLVSSLNIRADEETAHVTLFAPTDPAVNAFLYEMGLTFDELLARPVLVDHILSYHMIPGATIKSFNAKAKGENLFSTNPDQPTVMYTGDVNSVVKAYVSPITGLVNLIDMQGNQAVVVGEGDTYGNIQSWDISAVLMSASYFYNIKDALELYPQWSAASELFGKAAVASDALGTGLVGKAESTFIIPNNDALKPVAKALVNAPEADLVKVVQYHVIPGLKSVPKDWQNGASVQTALPGQKIKSVLSTEESVDVYTGEKVSAPLLKLVPAVGPAAEVTVYNIFAGKSMIMAVNGPLLPNIPAAAGILSAAKSGSGRRLLQLETRRSHTSNWAAQNTQRAINAAATGRIPNTYASRSGLRNAAAAQRGCVNCLRWTETW